MITFQDTLSGTYVDYRLKYRSLTAGVWYHVTISFEDSDLVVFANNKEYSAPKAKSLLGATNFYEKIKALDQMYVTVKGSVGDGAQVFTYIDNIRFSTSTASTSAVHITSREMDFNDGTEAQNYTASGWKAYKFGSNNFTQDASVLKIENRKLNSGDQYGSATKTPSLYCGGTTSKVTYNADGSSLGEFNHFAINIGTDGAEVSYSIELLTDSGETIYVAGGASYRATISTSNLYTSMKTISFNFAAKKIKTITIYASGSGNAHFYFDNIVFSKLT